MKARWKKHTLLFKRPSGTSRGVLKRKSSWFIILKDNEETYYGECGLLRGNCLARMSVKAALNRDSDAAPHAASTASSVQFHSTAEACRPWGGVVGHCKSHRTNPMRAFTETVNVAA